MKLEMRGWAEKDREGECDREGDNEGEGGDEQLASVQASGQRRLA